MKSRLRLRVTALALLLFTSVAARAGELETLLADAIRDSRVPAIGAVVIRDDKLDEMAVQGVRRNDAPEVVASDDAWLLGSTSKPMTVALIARLVERGTLSWNAPLATMLPDLATSMRPEYRGVTLVQLLSHTSGLPENLRDEHRIDPYFTDVRPLPAQRLAYIAQALAEPPVKVEDSKFSYSNSGFLVAAVIAERATGAAFETLMQDEVFKPLGMQTAGFGPTGTAQPQGHRGGKPVGPPMRSDDGVPAMFTAAGNMHMSLADWARFCIDQLDGAHGEGRLLKPESCRLMQTAQAQSPSGLDWGVQPSMAGRRGPVLAHGGSDGNWLAWVALFPGQRSGVLVIANAADDMGAGDTTHAVLAALLPTLSQAMPATK